ncbi:hypothetical protein SDC9_116284 [bioreactor metagenome]|uniref:Uncharacterized protein n=1 Tax=bioreactor metagenome TaxID=1076179 RepID=A0A645BV85_9ZZZZ
MTVPNFGFFARNGDVDGLQRKPRGKSGLLQQLLLAAYSLGKGLAYFVGQLSDHRPLLGRQGAHLFENGGELAFFAQIFDAQSFQIGGLLCGREAGDSFLADLLQFLLQHADTSFHTANRI